MAKTRPLTDYAPVYEPDVFSPEEEADTAPFFTNLTRSVYAPLIFSPELIGALCSRTSRATGELRRTFLREYITPFLSPEREPKETDEEWQAKQQYATDLRAFIDFLRDHPILDIFANPRARKFYATWLAQYGDDSIAQMAGSHLVFSGISQVAIKHLEDQRIGMAPIEQSTRYVDYRTKIAGRYRYYTPPELKDLGLTEAYESAMNRLFDTYSALIPKMTKWLTEQHPEEKAGVIEKKAFDVLRGLLPSATLSQVAFFGNGQAWEYAISRSGQHHLGEIRWVAGEILREVGTVTPAFVRRLLDTDRKEQVTQYQQYLAGRRARMAPFAQEIFADELVTRETEPRVELINYDPDGETQILTGLLYNAPNNHRTWSEVFAQVKQLSDEQKAAILEAEFAGRTQRWQKVARALENTYVRWEITMNIGAWRDLHRHRMLTQERQNFSAYHGYDVPPEIHDAGLEKEFCGALDEVSDVFAAIAARDPELAQYATALAHRIRFMQYENLRQNFWQVELRTIPEGHPDYRWVAQQKFRLLAEKYPLIATYIRANMGSYDFARRGQEEKIQAKLASMNKS